MVHRTLKLGGTSAMMESDFLMHLQDEYLIVFISISGPQLPQKQLRMSNVGGASEAIQANPLILTDGGHWTVE